MLLQVPALQQTMPDCWRAAPAARRLLVGILMAPCLVGPAPVAAQAAPFLLSSPYLAMGTFDNKFVLNGFGCSGGNVSPALEWRNLPRGTRSLALLMHDPDAPTGSGFWHCGSAPAAQEVRG